MIDFHSHILPSIDDGSKSVEESIEMLRLLKRQGITKVVMTPHFYANRNSVDGFLEKRKKSYDMLSEKLPDNLPEIYLGAEVKYYEGISRNEKLRNLCIGNTNLLLLEMSMSKWTEYTLRELCEISNTNNVIVVLAHIERYLKFQQKGTLEMLVSSGILIQANADFFISFSSRRKAINMLRNNIIHFIGSDCHNLDDRPPKMDQAISHIKRKAGNSVYIKLKHYADRFFNNIGNY